MQILVFGNEIAKEDSLPVRLLPKLKKLFSKIEFIHLDAIEEIYKRSKNPVIIDTVKGINEVRMIRLEEIKTQKLFSIHDFDLGYNLLLLKKLNLIKNAVIIGVPMNYDEENALKEIANFLSSLPAGSE